MLLVSAFDQVKDMIDGREVLGGEGCSHQFDESGIGDADPNKPLEKSWIPLGKLINS